MRVKFSVSTNKLRSEVTRESEIDDEDIEGLSEQELAIFIGEVLRDELNNYISTDYEIIKD